MKQKNVLYLFLLLTLCVAFVSCQGQAEVTADVGVTSAETSNFAESTVNETVEYAAVSLLTDNNYATSVEDFYASDITYKADLTHDGVEDICTIKVVGHGTECYEEELTITDGKSGEVIEVFSPVAYAHENIKFEQQETAYHIQTNGKVYEMKKETLDTPPEHLCDIGYGSIIDYTVKDGKLLCRMGIMCGIVEVCGEIVYEYSYINGEMVVTGIKLNDLRTETMADFGVVMPMTFTHALAPIVIPLADINDELHTITYEDPHAPDAVYYTDLTGDGVDDICTVHVDWYGAMSYGESVTVTDGKSGKNIPVVTPKDFTNANIEFCVQSDYSIVYANGMEYKFERIIFEAISSYLGGIVDFTVADGKIICGVTLEFEFANGDLEYDYSYVDGKLAVTGIKLYDYNKDVRADFGEVEPKSLYIPDEIAELLDMSAAEVREGYGNMKMEYSEREGPYQPVCSVEGIDGIFLVYHNWDMNTPITDDMHADEIIVTATDIGKIMGLRVGMNIEELPWRIEWEKAENRLVDGGFMLSSTFGEYAVTVGMGVEDVKEDIDDPDFWAKNAEKRRLDPKGEFNYLRVAKALKKEYENND